jgi:hypothetical protein
MPAPTPTELLAEDIRDLRETNHRMAARLDSLDAAVRDLGRDLGNLRADVATELGGMRAEMASEIGGLRADVVEKLGQINNNLEKFQARTETSLKIAGWAITLLIPLVFSLLGGAFWITWHAAKLDSRVERVESRLPKESPAIPAAGRPDQHG